MANNPQVNLENIAHLSYEKRFALEILEEIRQAKGTNAKIAILKKAKNNTGFINGLFLCYNPRIKFHLKKIPDYTPAAATAYHLEKVLDMLKCLHKREVTGNKAIAYLKDILETSDPMDAKFIEQIIRRDMQCGISTTSINEVIPGLIPVYDVMLCNSYDPEKLADWPMPSLVQIKYDGARANLHYNRKTGTVQLFLRSGEEIEEVPPHISDVVATELAVQRPFNQISFVLDGELLILSEPGSKRKYLRRQEGNGIVDKIKDGTATPEEISRSRFVVWDFTDMEAFWKGTWKVGYDDRYKALSLAISSMSVKGIVSCSETKYVFSPKEVKEYYAEKLSEGEEGACLKTLTGFWEAKRVPWQMKMKEVLEMDVRITGVYEGKPGSKYVGMCGGLTYESLDGIISGRVGSGLSDPQRKEFWQNPPIGRIANVEYNEVISEKTNGTKSLYLAVFVEIRVDIDHNKEVKA